MRRRTGFTLVEMLVAMALTLFIMVIISTAFVSGLETFRQLKAIGDMNQSLRMGTQRLEVDLRADHFEGKRKLSDLPFTLQGKVQQGFFRILRPNPSVAEPGPGGTDLDGLPSSRSVDQMLHFSVKLRGDRPQDFFSAAVPIGSPLDPDPKNANRKPTTFFDQPPDAVYWKPGTYPSQWAEVAYLLVKSGTTDDPTNPAMTTGTPLYSLYRVQRVVVPRNDQLMNLIPANQLAAYGQFSCQPDAANQFLVFNTPEDLANGQRSIVLPPPATAFPLSGSALVMSNVVSFQVQVSLNTVTANSIGQFQDLPNAEFDTAKQGNAPQRISGIQINFRIWEPNTEQTRQISLVQDM